MGIGLYKMIDGAKKGDLTAKDILLHIKPEMAPETKERLLALKTELEF